MRLSLLVLIVGAAGIAPTVPVRVLHRSPSTEGYDGQTRTSSMSLTEHSEMQAKPHAHLTAGRHGRRASTNSQKAYDVITQVYLANPQVKYGLWRLCEKALAEKHVAISKHRAEFILAQVRKAHGATRRNGPMSESQREELERLYGIGVTHVDELYHAIYTKYPEKSVSYSMVANWVGAKSATANLLKATEIIQQ